jgi:hypothetical protein
MQILSSEMLRFRLPLCYLRYESFVLHIIEGNEIQSRIKLNNCFVDGEDESGS